MSDELNPVDARLYVALYKLLDYTETLENALDNEGSAYTMRADLSAEARAAMIEYETWLGPIPEWASGWNHDRQVKLGAQLYTKNGAQIGNAHVVDIDVGLGVYITVLTDAGNYCQFTNGEVDSMFTVGKFISTVESIKQRFDRGKQN